MWHFVFRLGKCVQTVGQTFFVAQRLQVELEWPGWPNYELTGIEGGNEKGKALDLDGAATGNGSLYLLEIDW